MPSRQFRRIETPELQGDDSFVLVRSISVEKARELRLAISEINSENEKAIKEFETTNDVILSEDERDDFLVTTGREDKVNKLMAGLLSTLIVQWNWVDDNNNPLPQPKDDPGVFAKLTTDEYLFVSSLLSGNSEKN